MRYVCINAHEDTRTGSELAPGVFECSAEGCHAEAEPLALGDGSPFCPRCHHLWTVHDPEDGWCDHYPGDDHCGLLREARQFTQAYLSDLVDAGRFDTWTASKEIVDGVLGR